jgi:hypothetical protein
MAQAGQQWSGWGLDEVRNMWYRTRKTQEGTFEYNYYVEEMPRSASHQPVVIHSQY